MSAHHYTRITSYQNGLSFLGGKNERPIAHNTRIELDQGFLKIKYHGNPIVELHPDRIILSSCGWMTSTTKERLNWYIPDGYYIYQESGIWYIRNRDDDSVMVFQDRVTFHNDNTVSGYGSIEEPKRIKAMTQDIKAYVKGFIQALIDGEIESPNDGDCWSCRFKFGGKDHVRRCREFCH